MKTSAISSDENGRKQNGVRNSKMSKIFMNKAYV